MNGMQKTKQRQNTKPEEVVVEEVVTETTPERKAGYESLYAPEGMSNDAMSGWRTQLGTMNEQYGGDIRGYGSSDAFKTADVKKQNQYYTDLANFNALYNNVAGYDADTLKEIEKAKEAEEYANTRRVLMERYMPETLAAMGYANTGLAGDAVLKINNQYDNYILNAQKQASDNQSDLMTEYRNKAMEIESGINAEKQAVVQAQQDLYNEYLEQIYKGEGLDTAGVETAVQLGALTPEQAQDLYDKKKGWTGDGIKKVGDIELKQNTDSKQYLTTIDMSMGGEEVSELMNTNNSGVSTASKNRQKDFVNDVIAESKTWGKDMEGTLVDFNYGWKTKDKEKPSVYVFYWNPKTNQGEWKLTTLSRSDAYHNYKDRFLTGNMNTDSGWWDWTVRGHSWYGNLDEVKSNMKKKNESKTETK